MFWFLAIMIFVMLLLGEWLWTYKGYRGWAIGMLASTCIMWWWMMTYVEVVLILN